MTAYLASHVAQSQDLSLYTPKSTGRKRSKSKQTAANKLAASSSSSKGKGKAKKKAATATATQQQSNGNDDGDDAEATEAAAARKVDLLTLKGLPKPFALERLLSIYTAIRCAHHASTVTSSSSSHSSHLHEGQQHVARCDSDVGIHVENLVSAQLLSLCCSGHDLAALKYRCNISLEMALAYADHAQVDLLSYLQR